LTIIMDPTRAVNYVSAIFVVIELRVTCNTVVLCAFGTSHWI